MDWNDQVMERCGPELAVEVEAAPRFYRGPNVDRDADLVERLRRHEAAATDALVATYGDRVYRLAIRITGNSSDAEEVVQDALWAASRKIDTFRGTAAFGSWVYRITANAAYQKRRGRGVERNATSWDELAPAFDETGEQVDPGLDWSPRLKDPALQAELQSVLRTAIGELPVEHRATFVCATSKGSRTPRSRRRCRSTWPRSNRGSTGLGSFCEAAWPPTWAEPPSPARASTGARLPRGCGRLKTRSR
jgi:RNA polymerase sigma-70 factor (ECF subfamily)